MTIEAQQQDILVELGRLTVETEGLRADLMDAHSLNKRLREELMLARSQLESVLAILRRTYDDVRNEQTRAAEQHGICEMENACEQDEGA
jgi:hypothetical protein